MAQVKLKIYFKNKDGNDFKQIVGFLNPNCDNKILTKFADNLNNLTTNKLTEVMRCVEEFLSDCAPESEISEADLIRVIDGKYIPPTAEDLITDDEIKLVIGGKFVPTEDDFSDDEFIF